MVPVACDLCWPRARQAASGRVSSAAMAFHRATSSRSIPRKMAHSGSELTRAQASMTAVGETQSCHRSACGRSRRRPTARSGSARTQGWHAAARMACAAGSGRRPRMGCPPTTSTPWLWGPTRRTGAKRRGCGWAPRRGWLTSTAGMCTLTHRCAGADIQALTVTPEGDLVASVAGRGVWRRGQADGWQTLGKGALVGEGPLALWAAAGWPHLGRDEQRLGLLPGSGVAAPSAAG